MATALCWTRSRWISDSIGRRASNYDGSTIKFRWDWVESQPDCIVLNFSRTLADVKSRQLAEQRQIGFGNGWYYSSHKAYLVPPTQSAIFDHFGFAMRNYVVTLSDSAGRQHQFNVPWWTVMTLCLLLP